jgi:hypothetical protein
MEESNLILESALMVTVLALLFLESRNHEVFSALGTQAVVLFSLAFLYRVAIRPFRSLALDFSWLRARRYERLSQAWVLRGAMLSAALVSAFVFYFYLQGLAPKTVALWGLVSVVLALNTAMLCSLRTLDSWRCKFFYASLVFQWCGGLAPILLGVGFGGVQILFFVVALLLGGWGFFTSPPQAPRVGAGLPLQPTTFFEFDWQRGALGNRDVFSAFLREVRLLGGSVSHMDRRTKILEVLARDHWLQLLKKFPLQLVGWREISKERARERVQEASLARIPENSISVSWNVFGFWTQNRGATRPLTEEEGRLLYQLQRNREERPFDFRPTQGMDFPKLAVKGGYDLDDSNQYWVASKGKSSKERG